MTIAVMREGQPYVVIGLGCLYDAFYAEPTCSAPYDRQTEAAPYLDE